METDPIVDEVRSVPDEFAKHHGYDINAMIRALAFAFLASSACC